MAEFFVMPQASPTMEVGVVAKWVAPEGTELKPQSVIAQVETDKATMDIEVFDTCVLLKHLVAEGAEVPAGAPIAIIGKAKGEDVSALIAEYERTKGAAAAPDSGGAPAAAPTAAAGPAPAEAAAPAPAEAAPAGPPAAATAAPPSGAASATAAAPAAAAPTSVVAPAPVLPAPAAPVPPTNAGVVPTLSWMGRAIPDAIMEPLGAYVPATPRVIASPLARAIASDKGVRIEALQGTGPGGRIVAADVEVAAAAPPASPRAAPSAPSARADATVRATQMRKTIARRLTEVHQQVPVFFLTVTFDASGMVALKEAATTRGIKISYNDMVLKAVAMALADVPECNAAWNTDSIIRRGAVDIGVAVALPDGLITPVIRSANTKSVRAIGAEVRELAGRARDNRLTPDEYTGASFSISNLGMFDIDHFTAILNPPEAGILAVGSVQEVPVVQRGVLAVGWRMKVTMTCDHRVIDGALGARLLQALRGYIEVPALMVL